ncbi:DUF503 domain-containing protein [Chloroflexota bacterium]
MAIGVLTLQIEIPGCKSLKGKRSRLKPLLSRLHREFNISVAEIDHHDAWQSAVIACALISNSPKHTQRALQNVATWVEEYWPDVTVIDDHVEIIY